MYHCDNWFDEYSHRHGDNHANAPIDSNSVIDKLALHIPSGFAYWIDNSTYSSYRGINRAKTDGSQYSRLITSGVGTGGIQGLAIDWAAGGRLYFF